MQPPVKEAVGHGKSRGIPGRPRQVLRRIEIVVEGFRHSPEDEPDPHPRREEHAEPPEIAVLRLLMILSQLDAAVLACGNCHGEYEEEKCRKQVRPPEVLDDAAVQRLGDVVELVGRRHAVPYENHDDQQRDDEYPLLAAYDTFAHDHLRGIMRTEHPAECGSSSAVEPRTAWSPRGASAFPTTMRDAPT